MSPQRTSFGLDLDAATYGCELEMGDVDTHVILPDGNTWCYKDGSICNSNGTANDPKKKLNRYGSEIQVKPASSPEELLRTVKGLYGLLPRKDFNFTTNLHVHIRVPGLKDNLPALKRLAEYLRKNDSAMFNLIDPIPQPLREDYDCLEAWNGALRRFKRRQRSHHYGVSDAVYLAMMKARTPQEFYEAHALLSHNGKRQWHLVVRAGVNLKQLWCDTETIEFRCFTMSLGMDKMLSAFRWPGLLLEAALVTGATPAEILSANRSLVFQRFHPYNYKMDRVFLLTNVLHNSREEARKNYEALIAQGVLRREDLS